MKLFDWLFKKKPDGTINRPFKTMQDAMNACNGNGTGQTIYLMPSHGFLVIEGPLEIIPKKQDYLDVTEEQKG